MMLTSVRVVSDTTILIAVVHVKLAQVYDSVYLVRVTLFVVCIPVSYLIPHLLCFHRSGGAETMYTFNFRKMGQPGARLRGRSVQRVGRYIKH